MKKSRQEKIIELIQTEDIETQEELAEKLRLSGFSVTQATVSRDIRTIGLTKAPVGDGRQKYTVLSKEEPGLGDKYVRVLKDAFFSIEAAQNILVIKTASGMAMAAASALDALKFPEIVGCVAGDDTIFAVTHDGEEACRLTERIHGVIQK